MALYGIYGRHEIDQCPWNNKERAKEVVEIANSDFASMLPNYKIHNIVGQYHSGLEHTFLWVLDAKDGQTVETLMIQTGIAKFNALKIVPLLTFENVIEKCKQV